MTTKEALFSLEGIKVLVIGDIILDIYIQGKVDRISPEAPVPVVNHIHTGHILGGAANVAANLKGLNTDVKLIAITGDDTEGEYLETMLDLEGISHHLMRCSALITNPMKNYPLKKPCNYGILYEEVLNHSFRKLSSWKTTTKACSPKGSLKIFANLPRALIFR
jgi:hypothetical protein